MGTTKPKDIKLDKLLDKLAFAQEETASAAETQPLLYMAAAEYRTQKMRTRQEAEMHVDNLRVDLSLKFRTKFKGVKGTTERAIGDMVDRVPEYRDAIAQLARAKRKEEYAKLLLDAYEHRRSSIKVLAQFAFMQDTFSGTGIVDSLTAKRRKLQKEMGRIEDE